MPQRLDGVELGCLHCGVVARSHTHEKAEHDAAQYPQPGNDETASEDEGSDVPDRDSQQDANQPAKLADYYRFYQELSFNAGLSGA